jgi:pimeloyl-ACP methyl ester carboxylesterase
VNQSGIIDANGARLYFETAGYGEALVFIHGLGLDARMWDLQFEVFAQRFLVIRYDLRGFGRSSVPTAEGYSHAEDLHALLRFLRVQQAHILGLSFAERHAVNFENLRKNAKSISDLRLQRRTAVIDAFEKASNVLDDKHKLHEFIAEWVDEAWGDEHETEADEAEE